MTATIIVLLSIAVVVLVVLVVLLILHTLHQSDELKEKNKIIVREVQRRSVLEGRMLTMLFACSISFLFDYSQFINL